MELDVQDERELRDRVRIEFHSYSPNRDKGVCQGLTAEEAQMVDGGG